MVYWARVGQLPAADGEEAAAGRLLGLRAPWDPRRRRIWLRSRVRTTLVCIPLVININFWAECHYFAGRRDALQQQEAVTTLSIHRESFPRAASEQ